MTTATDSSNASFYGETDQLRDAVLGLVARAAAESNLRGALVALVSPLPALLSCDSVGLALVTSTGRVRLEALSNVATPDRRTPLATALESALAETALADAVLSFPNYAEHPRALTLSRPSSISGKPGVITAPLKDASGRLVAVLALLTEGGLQQDEACNRVEALAPHLGPWLRLLVEARQGLWQHARRALGTALSRRRGRAFALAAGILLAAGLLPVPFRLACHCTVEPVVRRYVSAPFAATLNRTFVRPGDSVKAGDPLAELDGRELRMQLASRQAELEQARRRQDAALARRDAPAAELARMEVRQADMEVQLLEQRGLDLLIKSPMDGIVVAGDLERVEGAPLTVGQRLFEVAPLDRVVVEVDVPEQDIGHVQEGMAADLQLDALPGVGLRGSIGRVHPRAELRRERSVFVAEVALPPEAPALLPGMTGQARCAGYRCLAWVLLHRPWEKLRQALGW